MDAVRNEPRLIRAREAAQMLDASVETLRRSVHDGAIPAVRLRDRGWPQFRRADIELMVVGEPTGAGDDDA